MNQLLLRVVLLAAAVPVTVGLVNGLGLLLALVSLHVLLQVLSAAELVLQKVQVLNMLRFLLTFPGVSFSIQSRLITVSSGNVSMMLQES